MNVDAVAYDLKTLTEVDDQDKPEVINREALVKIPELYNANFQSFLAVPISDVLVTEKREKKYEKVLDNAQYLASKVDSVAAVSEILSKRFPTTSDWYDKHSGFTHLHFPYSHNTIKIKESKFLDQYMYKEENNNYWRFLSPNFGRRTTVAPDNILYTVIKRFGGNKVQEFSDKKYIRLLRNSFEDLITKITPIKVDDLAIAYAEQIKRIKLKGDVTNALEMKFNRRDISKISLFNKPQKKVKMAAESYLQVDSEGTLKAGQPVSAQPKFVTHLMGTIITVLEKNIRRDFKKHVLLGYGYSKRRLNEEVVFRLQGLKEHVCFESDITEMDSVRNTIINEGLMSYVYERYGVDEKLYNWMQSCNENWSGDADAIRMTVKGMFQSGRADTLFSNSLVNLVICNMAFNIKSPRLIMSQGDDFVCIAEDIHIEMPFNFFKCGKVDLPEFTSDIITQDGIFPSIIKKTGKLLNREFKHYDDYLSYQIAVRDWFQGYYSIEDYHKIILLNSFKYKLPYVEIQYCLDFMLTFANTTTYDPIKLGKGKRIHYQWHQDMIRTQNTTMLV